MWSALMAGCVSILVSQGLGPPNAVEQIPMMAAITITAFTDVFIKDNIKSKLIY
jgi:hypothetical protein